MRLTPFFPRSLSPTRFAEPWPHRLAQLPGDGRDGLHEAKARLQVVVAATGAPQHNGANRPDGDPGAGGE